MPIRTVLVLGEIVGRTKQRVLTMRRLGYVVDVLSIVPKDYMAGINDQLTFFDRVWNKLGFPRDKTQLNQRLLHQLQKETYDLVWVEKSLILKAATIKRIQRLYPSLKIVWFAEDDMFARHNQSYYFKKALPLYDVVFTTKSYNCDRHELPALGAKRVVFVDKSYDPTLHRPVMLSPEDQQHYAADVAFIGTFEQDRFEKMHMLAKRGIRVRIWGNGWKSVANSHPNLQIENRPIYDEMFVKALQSTKINLCFLRKINRDLQTDRTMEIPACRAFMLAERTNEHLRLFEESKEAAYFDNDNFDELYEKVKYFLAHDEERMMIAKAGYDRCMCSHYSHDDRIRYMFGKV